MLRLYYMSHKRMENMIDMIDDNSLYTTNVIDMFKKYKEMLLNKDVFVKSQKDGFGIIIDKGQEFEVVMNKGKYKCSCQREIALGIPCVHTYALIQNSPKRIKIDKLIHPMFTKKCIMKFHQSLPSAIVFNKSYSINGIDSCYPPVTYIPRHEKRKEAFH